MRKVCRETLNVNMTYKIEIYITLNCSMNFPRCGYRLTVLPDKQYAVIFLQAVHVSVSPADVQMPVEIKQRLGCLRAPIYCHTLHETCTCSCPAFFIWSPHWRICKNARYFALAVSCYKNLIGQRGQHSRVLCNNIFSFVIRMYHVVCDAMGDDRWDSYCAFHIPYRAKLITPDQVTSTNRATSDKRLIIATPKNNADKRLS